MTPSDFPWVLSFDIPPNLGSPYLAIRQDAGGDKEKDWVIAYVAIQPNAQEIAQVLLAAPRLLRACQYGKACNDHISDGCDECENDDSPCPKADALWFRFLEANEDAIKLALGDSRPKISKPEIYRLL